MEDHSFHFMPHGHCYLWTPTLLWLQVVTNSLIGGAYVSIAATLAFLVTTVRDIPFQRMYLAFGIFIITCGFTHFMDIWVIWNPDYWIDSYLRAVTAIASVGTAILLPPLIPKAISLAQGAKAARDHGIRLESAYRELGIVFEKTKELDRLKTQFFANVSHDLRTPLTLILGPVESLLRDPLTPVSHRRDLEIVNRNARILLKQVNDLLDVARIEARKLTPLYSRVDAARLIRVICANFESLARERSIEFKVIAPKNLVVDIDPEQFRRVVINLLSNAFKFTNNNAIKFTDKRENHSQIEVEISDIGDHVRVVVNDSGPGIPLAQRGAVFDRFRQIEGGDARRFGGTGLGLSIAKEYVELHKGRIWVEEAQAGGASFRFEIPKVAPNGVTIVPLSEAHNGGLEDTVVSELRSLEIKPTQLKDVSPEDASAILVVEDNPDLNEFLASTLSPTFRVERAYNGKEGLHLAREVKPDLIITDVMMPEMSGDEMVREIRKISEISATPVIMLTAKASDELKIQLLSEGAQDFLVKPFYPDEVLARARNLVAMNRARRMLQTELHSQGQDVEKLVEEVTLQRRELQAAVAMRDEFLSIASHELKTPLTSLKMQLQISARSLKPSAGQMPTMEALDKSFQNSLKQVDTITHLVNQLLDVSRIRAGKMELVRSRFDLGAVVREVCERFHGVMKSAGIEFVAEIQNGLFGNWDQARVEQVVTNLLSNAVKYASSKPVKLMVRSVGNMAEIVVEDQGPGIPADARERIFERFERATSYRHISGLGLGLFIVKNIAEAHQGSARLDVSYLSGSRFVITLPLTTSSTEG